MTEITVDIRQEPGDKHRRHIYVDNELRGTARYSLNCWHVMNAIGHMLYWPRDEKGGRGPVSARRVEDLAAPVKRAFEIGLLPPKAMLDAEVERNAKARRLGIARDDYKDLIERSARDMLTILRRLDRNRDFRVRVQGELQDQVAAMVTKLAVPVVDGQPIEEIEE